MKLQDILTTIQEYHPNPDLDLINRAYAFVREQHEGQTRASGEPYITHVTEVAYLACKLKLDTASVAAALLHDTVEDTVVAINEIQAQFGNDIAYLVDGVTKLSQVNFSSREEQQAENFRKMLLAMAKDIRVLLIKLSDRTHNMRTLEYLSEARQVRIAQETLEIYAPLAHRLGIHWMKSELEDLSFRYLKPGVFNSIKELVKQKKRERERYIDQVVKLISTELQKNGITGSVSGRPKSFYSIYQKMERQGVNFDEIYDLTAFRVIVPTLMDCYGALGVVHAAWKPIPGRFKDYIAIPKANGYQSLHTTVIGPGGSRIEIQIRTQEMHDIADKGIAAHWIYKEKSGSSTVAEEEQVKFTWLKDLLESESLLRDPHEFMAVVKDNLFPQEVFVFSPKGDLMALTAGSTPLDFAYKIHTEVGHHCTGAKVNGQQVPFSYTLRNGDTVEIITSPNQRPSKDWMRIVVTSKAKQRIRSWLKSEERLRSIAIGREVLTKDLRKIKLSFAKLLKDEGLKQAAHELGFREVDLMLAEIGYGKLSTTQVVERLLPEESNIEEKLSKEDSTLQKIFQRAAKAFRDNSGVKVNGLDGVVFRFAKCCEPLPGDELIGFITRGRGVAIHKRGCAQAMSFDPRRLIEVSWDETVKTMRRVQLKILTLDKVGVLATMTQCISSQGANIVSANVSPTENGKAINTFDINIESTEQLDRLTRALERMDGVLRIERGRSGFR